MSHNILENITDQYVFVYNHLYGSEVEKALKHLLTQFIGEATEIEEVEIGKCRTAKEIKAECNIAITCMFICNQKTREVDIMLFVSWLPDD